MNAPVNPNELELQTVEFKLDGKAIVAYEGETILKAAKRHGVDIPHLCFKDGYRPDGNCRACVVEINGERTLDRVAADQPLLVWKSRRIVNVP